MTPAGHMVTCDFRPDERKARVAVGRLSFEKSWETVAMQDGPDLHLCPICAGIKSVGRLVEGFLYYKCERCGRTTDDNPEVETWCAIGEGQHMCGDCGEV